MGTSKKKRNKKKNRSEEEANQLAKPTTRPTRLVGRARTRLCSGDLCRDDPLRVRILSVEGWGFFGFSYSCFF